MLSTTGMDTDSTDMKSMDTHGLVVLVSTLADHMAMHIGIASIEVDPVGMVALGMVADLVELTVSTVSAVLDSAVAVASVEMVDSSGLVDFYYWRTD